VESYRFIITIFLWKAKYVIHRLISKGNLNEAENVMWTEYLYMWLSTEFSVGACEQWCTFGLHNKWEIYGQLTDHWLLNKLLRHVFHVKPNDMHTALQNSYMFQPLFLNYFSQNINGTPSTNILPHCSNTVLHKYVSFTLCPTSQLKSLLVGHLYSRCLWHESWNHIASCRDNHS
jgi:hypothetical protein